MMVSPYKVWWVRIDTTLSLPEVVFEARGKVMEMEEYSRSRGLPAILPEALL